MSGTQTSLPICITEAQQVAAAVSEGSGFPVSAALLPAIESECANVIRALQPNSISDKFAMGDALRSVAAVKADERGAFARWLRGELGMSRAAATRLMMIAAAIDAADRDVVAQRFDLGALYELTSVRGRTALPAAISQARWGDQVTARVAKELVCDHARIKHAAGVVKLPDALRIECCDFRDLDIPDASVDMILTDPPYDEASVPLYGEVAKLGRRVLRPGGWCLAYAGKMYLARIHYRMKQHLDYSFQFDVPHARPTLIKSLAIEQNGKYIVGYRREPEQPWWSPVSDRVSGTIAKDLHKWQQPIEEAEQLISGLCPEGGVVCDPMCGSGTTLVAALRLGRQIIGADVDADAVDITKRRLAGIVIETDTDEAAT